MAEQKEHKIEARVFLINDPKGKTVAFAGATIDDAFAITGMQVVDGKNGLFAQMPQTKDKEGNFRDVAFPVTTELRQQLNSAVVNTYLAEKEKVSVKDTIKKDKVANTAPPSTEKSKTTKSKPEPSR